MRIAAIGHSLQAGGQTYGARRAWRGVSEGSRSCDLRRVELPLRRSVMQPPPEAARHAEGWRRAIRDAGDILDRAFASEGPNQKRPADLIHALTAKDWLCLAAAPDVGRKYGSLVRLHFLPRSRATRSAGR